MTDFLTYDEGQIQAIPAWAEETSYDERYATVVAALAAADMRGDAGRVMLPGGLVGIEWEESSGCLSATVITKSPDWGGWDEGFFGAYTPDYAAAYRELATEGLAAAGMHAPVHTLTEQLERTR